MRKNDQRHPLSNVKLKNKIDYTKTKIKFKPLVAVKTSYVILSPKSPHSSYS